MVIEMLTKGRIDNKLIIKDSWRWYRNFKS